VLEKFPNDVNYVIKHFPLPNHQFAHQSAMAALAAGNQGKFWEFHRQLLENYNQINDDKILEIATGMALNMDQFNQDRQSVSSRQLIHQDIENGKKIGVRGTPIMFMNGKRVHNPFKVHEFIMKELGK
jgi:protein-disulfide isomerase